MNDDFRMKRDLDLCLTILKKLAHHPAEEVRFRPLDIEGFDQETIGYHVWLLGNGGYLDITHNQTTAGSFKYVQVNEITWQGHEFLDAAQNQTVWKKFKEKLKEKGESIPFSIAHELLITITKSEIGLA